MIIYIKIGGFLMRDRQKNMIVFQMQPFAWKREREIEKERWKNVAAHRHLNQGCQVQKN